MEAINTNYGPLARTDHKSHLSVAAPGAGTEYPEVSAWFEEAKRLFAEAEKRFEAGEILPALSSLAGVPPLHSMLTSRCIEMFEGTTAFEPDFPAEGGGMYL